MTRHAATSSMVHRRALPSIALAAERGNRARLHQIRLTWSLEAKRAVDQDHAADCRAVVAEALAAIHYLDSSRRADA